MITIQVAKKTARANCRWKDRSTAIDYSDSSKVLFELKGKYSLDSAPGVPNKETVIDILRIDPSIYQDGGLQPNV